MENGSWKAFLEEHYGKNHEVSQYGILHLTEKMIGFFYESFVYERFPTLKELNDSTSSDIRAHFHAMRRQRLPR